MKNNLCSGGVISTAIHQQLCCSPNLSQRALCLWAGRAESFLASLASCSLPGLSLGGTVDALTVTRHRLVPARMCGSAASWQLPAPCPLLRACLCSCDRRLAESETRGTWQLLLRSCQGVAVLWIRLGCLKSSCVGDVNTVKCVNGRSASFTYLGNTFINYYLKARAFFKIHCILCRWTFSCTLLWQVEIRIGCGLCQN